jgi:hypothetical protein
MPRRKLDKLTQAKLRSVLTNGTQLLRGIDHRTAAMRRMRDLLAAYEQDLGGVDLLSAGQQAIIRRATMITIQAEMLEQKWASNGGVAANKDLETYQRCANTLRRLVESLDLHRGRKPRDTSLIENDEIMKLYNDELNREQELVP